MQPSQGSRMIQTIKSLPFYLAYYRCSINNACHSYLQSHAAKGWGGPGQAHSSSVKAG